MRAKLAAVLGTLILLIGIIVFVLSIPALVIILATLLAIGVLGIVFLFIGLLFLFGTLWLVVSIIVGLLYATRKTPPTGKTNSKMRLKDIQTPK